MPAGIRPVNAVNKVTLDIRQLQALRKQLADNKGAVVRVGILGNRNERFDINTSTTTRDKLNTPTRGLIHEFGSVANNIPERSFLRMPLLTRLPSKVNQIGRQVWRDLVTGQGLLPALKQLGVLGENIVQEAFATRGFGQWAANKAATIRRKKSSMPLIDTAQLRKSVTSEVVPGRK